METEMVVEDLPLNVKIGSVGGRGWSNLRLLKGLLGISDHGPESKWDCSAQRQAEGQEEGHDGPCRLCLMLWHLLGSEAHAETGQVSVGEGEDDHEDDVQGVVFKHHGEVVTRLDIAQHEERYEDDSQTHQDRKPQTVFTRPHTDGCQTPASPVHHVEEEETWHGDEVHVPAASTFHWRLDLDCYSWKCSYGDGEDEAYWQSHHPDLFENV